MFYTNAESDLTEDCHAIDFLFITKKVVQACHTCIAALTRISSSVDSPEQV